MSTEPEAPRYVGEPTQEVEQAWEDLIYGECCTQSFQTLIFIPFLHYVSCQFVTGFRFTGRFFGLSPEEAHTLGYQMLEEDYKVGVLWAE